MTIPKAAILIVHELCEHLGRYEYVSGQLNSAGFSVYRFDHRGHGRSKGKRTFFRDFHQIADDVNHMVEMVLRENPATPLFVLGHSMGGFAVTLFGTKYPGKIKGLITSGALTWYNARAGKNCRSVWYWTRTIISQTSSAPVFAVILLLSKHI